MNVTTKKKKAFCVGQSIILPHVRFVRHGRLKTMMMFHSIVMKTNGKHKTLGCNKMDDSGFCLGHEMSRKDFLNKYCHGIEVKKSKSDQH